MTRKFHHAELPKYSTLLCGHMPPDDAAFQSDILQIWYNNTENSWTDKSPHYHEKSDEIFIVLRGALHVEVEGEIRRVGPREFCCFPAGQWHSIVRVEVPVETLMIRAPSVDDKVVEENHD